MAQLARHLQSINADSRLKQSVPASSQFLYVTYKTVDGSCLKSFPNPYIETRFETRFLAPLAFAFRPHRLHSRRCSDAWFSLLPSPTTPFPWGVEMAPADVVSSDRPWPTVERPYRPRSAEARGDLSVQFDAGAPFQPITFGVELIGDMSMVSALWASEPFNLHDGLYRVRLSAAASPGGQIKMVLGTVSDRRQDQGHEVK